MKFLKWLLVPVIAFAAFVAYGYILNFLSQLVPEFKLPSPVTALPLRRQSVKSADGTNGPNMTLYQRLQYGCLISKLICQINHTICFCFSVTEPKINHRIRMPNFCKHYPHCEQRLWKLVLVL